MIRATTVRSVRSDVRQLSFHWAERVYVSDERRTRDQLTVDVSIHDFGGRIHDPPTGESVGATQAQRWFGDQRANDLGLTRETKTRAELEEELGPVTIEALDNIVIDALYNDSEYTLYARQGAGRVPRPAATYPPTTSFVSVFLENRRSAAAAGAAKWWPIRSWRKSLALISSRLVSDR